MPIRQRKAPVITELDFGDTQVAIIDQQSDNDIMGDERAEDFRGVFNPKQDPFPGSLADILSNGDRRLAGGVLRHVAYTQPDTVAYPKDVKVQDLLAQARIPYNYGDSVEQSYRDRIRSPLTGIRAFCVECRGGSPRAVKTCDVMECPFWVFRMGKNAIRGRA